MMKKSIWILALGVVAIVIGAAKLSFADCGCSISCPVLGWSCSASGACPCSCVCDGTSPSCSCGSSGGGKIVPQEQ